MIPTKLVLKNFTSYTNPPELDFAKFKMAAISGFNGAGKSSLLDAITWCLWGTSRAGDSSDPLVHTGAEEMAVAFSFDLDGHEYTVKRSRLKKGGGTTNLEFWSNSHNLTEGTIKATQQKIIESLHLSFETFSNSAFLRQGHADEFTTKGPTDRKRILADILGLDHYDKLEEKAKEKVKEAQTQLSLLEYQVLEIEAELSQKEEREKNLSLIQEEGEKAQKELKEIEEKYRAIESEKNAVENLIYSLKDQEERYLAIQKELLDLKAQVEVKNEAIKEFKEILEQRGKIEKAFSKLEGLQKEKEKLEVKRSELIKVKDELASIQKRLIERENKRSQALASVEIQIKEVETQNTEYKNHIDALTQKKDLCPTCGQIIDSVKNKELIETNKKKLEENTLKLRELLATLEKYKAIVLPEQKESEEKEKAVGTLEEETKEWFELQREVSELEETQKLYLKLKEAQAGVKAHEDAIKDLEKIINQKEIELQKAKDYEEKLKLHQEKLFGIEQRLKSEQTIKEAISQKLLDLRTKYGEAKLLVTRTTQLEELSKQKLSEKQKFTKEKDIYEELSLAFGKKGIQAMIIENAIPEIEDETNKLLEKLTEGRMKIAFETQRETKTKVATIDGKKEHSTVETLDIIISDEMGERPYEMYSVDGNELVYICQNEQIKSVPIQELWADNVPTKREGEYYFQKVNIEALCYVGGKAVWQKVDKILRHRAPKKILEVKCSNGNYTVKLTKNHSVYILTPQGLQVKRTDQLKAGDYLLSPRSIPQRNNLAKLDLSAYITKNFLERRSLNNKGIKMNEDSIWSRLDQKINRYVPLNSEWGKLLGLAVAEGSGYTSYSIAAGSNSELASEAVTLASRSFGTARRSLLFISEEAMLRYAKQNPGISSLTPKAQYRPSIGGRLIAHIMKNMVGEKASLKRVPDFVFNTPTAVKLSFIKGLIAGDGYTYYDARKSKSQVALTTTSRRLAGELVFLCRQIGVWARIEKHGEAGFQRGMHHLESYRVVIAGKKNLEILGMGKIVSKYDTATKYEGIPYNLVGVLRANSKRFPRGVSNQSFDCGIRRIPKNAHKEYLRMQKIVQDWNILEVKEITEIDPTSEYVYDLMVPRNNSFVAGNGAILVHNSGGEAFRVNFAIRLAISKLLTHRAGARLQFLVIDEGFGTQDAPGRARLVEILDAIKQDFEKILIITHLDELKEEFPTRIEVSKSAGGSTFEVVG